MNGSNGIKCIRDSDCDVICSSPGTRWSDCQGGECKCKCWGGYGGQYCEVSPDDWCKTTRPQEAAECAKKKNSEFAYKPMSQISGICECRCKSGWMGKDCLYSREFTCNNRGIPNIDAKSGYLTQPPCYCDSKDGGTPLAFGSHCEYTPENTCNGNGTPQVGQNDNDDDFDKLLDPPCKCYADFYGDTCADSADTYCQNMYPNFGCKCTNDCNVADRRTCDSRNRQACKWNSQDQKCEDYCVRIQQNACEGPCEWDREQKVCKRAECDTYVFYNKEENKCVCDCWPDDRTDQCYPVCSNGYSGDNCEIPPQGQCSAEVCQKEKCSEAAPFLCTEGQAKDGCGSEDGWAGAACSNYCDTRTCRGGGNLPQCNPSLNQLCPPLRRGGPGIPCPASGQCPYLNFELR